MTIKFKKGVRVDNITTELITAMSKVDEREGRIDKDSTCSNTNNYTPSK